MVCIVCVLNETTTAHCIQWWTWKRPFSRKDDSCDSTLAIYIQLFIYCMTQVKKGEVHFKIQTLKSASTSMFHFVISLLHVLCCKIFFLLLESMKPRVFWWYFWDCSIEEGYIQKKRQRSSLLFGVQYLFSFAPGQFKV